MKWVWIMIDPGSQEPRFSWIIWVGLCNNNLKTYLLTDVYYIYLIMATFERKYLKRMIFLIYSY